MIQISKILIWLITSVSLCLRVAPPRTLNLVVNYENDAFVWKVIDAETGLIEASVNPTFIGIQKMTKLDDGLMVQLENNAWK